MRVARHDRQLRNECSLGLKLALCCETGVVCGAAGECSLLLSAVMEPHIIRRTKMSNWRRKESDGEDASQLLLKPISSNSGLSFVAAVDYARGSGSSGATSGGTPRQCGRYLVSTR
jgi:hypothetical protein